jgi:hypothetical protein
MLGSGKTDGQLFRVAAAPLFIFLLGIGLPLYFAITVFKFGAHFQLKALLIGAGSMIPAAIIVAGLMSMLFPVRLSTQGIAAQSIWGFSSFIRWQEIKQARQFRFFNLRWLRLFSTTGSVTWVAMFPAHPGAFRLEIEKLAPPENPVLTHFK